jgi:hypothetical protein
MMDGMVAWSTEKCLISDFFLMLVSTEGSAPPRSPTLRQCPLLDIAQFSGSQKEWTFSPPV